MQDKKMEPGILFAAGVGLSMAAASIYSSMSQQLPVYGVTANIFISVLLSFILVQYVKRSQLKQNREIQDKLLFIILFFGTNMLMAFVETEKYGFLWLLPVMLAAVSTVVEYAIVVYAVLLIQNILLHATALSAWDVVTAVIYGFFCIWLMQQKLSMKVLPYLFISMLSVDGILQILKRQFQLSLLKKEMQQVVTELASVLVLELFILCYLKYREGKQSRSGAAEEEPEESLGESAEEEPEESRSEDAEEEAEESRSGDAEEEPEESQSGDAEEEPEESRSGDAEEEPEESQSEDAEEESRSEAVEELEETESPQTGERDLADVLAEDYSLRLRLEEYSESLFRHSLRISNIASETACHMDGNVPLAQAGGLYHEIGKIVNEKNYIDEGEHLLREDRVPDELIAIVRQHTALEKPQSLEAAIVMLADYIITTSAYLEKAGRRKDISDEKLVNTIFANRMQKGNLDEAGLSDRQIGQLKEFFIKHIFTIQSDGTEE